MHDQDIHDELRFKRNRESLKQLNDRLKREQRREAREQAERWFKAQNYPAPDPQEFYRP